MQAIEFVRQRLFLSAAIAGVLAGSAVGLFLPIRASAGDATSTDSSSRMRRILRTCSAQLVASWPLPR